MATTCRDLPEMELNLKNSQEDVYKLLRIIKPAWKRDHIKIKILSGGYSCHMLRCSEDSGESITVRVRNLLDGFRDPALERQVVKVMSANGYFPPLLAIFQNGFCYEYIKGRPVYMKDALEISVDEEQLRLIAQEMANIHSVKVPAFNDEKGSLFDFILGMLSDAKPCFEGCPSVEELIQEVRLVEECVSIVRSPLVQIHGDSHPANMVWNQEQNKLTYVDCELSQVAPRAYDIVYFLNSFDVMSYMMKVSVRKPTDIERKFCVHYLTRWNERSDQPTPTEDEIEQLLLEVKYFFLPIQVYNRYFSQVTKVVWLVYVVRFADVMSIFGTPESLWKHNFERYIRTKDDILGIKTFGLPTAEIEPSE